MHHCERQKSKSKSLLRGQISTVKRQVAVSPFVEALKERKGKERVSSVPKEACLCLGGGRKGVRKVKWFVLLS